MLNNNELREAADNIMTALSYGIENTGKIGKNILRKLNDQSFTIYKGRHENPIFQKIKGIENGVIDKIKPIDRFHLIDKLQQSVSTSEDGLNTNFFNYRIDINDESVYQESTDGQVNLNKIEPFFSLELESERNGFTIADAFSSEYDPPPSSQFKSEPELEPSVADIPPPSSQFKSEPELEPSVADIPPPSSQFKSEPELEPPVADTSPPSSQFKSEPELEPPVADTSPPSSQFKPDKKNIAAEISQANRDADTIFSFINRDLKTVKSSRAKSLLQSAVSQLRDGISKINKAISRQFEIGQQKSVAQTFKKLFDANIQQTGEITFKSNTFDVRLRGANTYEVTDKEGNIKLKFQQERFSGLKIEQSSLSGEEFKLIQKATQSVNSLGADKVLQQDLAGRVSLLGSIAPESDHQIMHDLDINGVVKTAKSFLHYMGVESWNREGGQYQIEKSDNNLRIIAKNNDREILRLHDGKLSSRLKPKDIDFFRKLDSSVKNEVNKIREKENNRDLPSKLTSPKIFKQQELSR